MFTFCFTPTLVGQKHVQVICIFKYWQALFVTCCKFKKILKMDKPPIEHNIYNQKSKILSKIDNRQSTTATSFGVTNL